MYISQASQLKPSFRALFNQAEIMLNNGKKIFGVKTTTKMSVGDFCQYMNRLLLYWQEKTNGEFMMSELPANYLERKGYTIR